MFLSHPDVRHARLGQGFVELGNVVLEVENLEKAYGDKGPQSWADFWDVKKFPGKRAYRKGVAGALEPALMADGVPPNKVYEVLSQPGGIERALKKIRELKPHIAVWWSSGAQHAQLMKDGEVDMTTGWNGRFDVVAKDGGKVAYTFNQALLDYDCFAVPKGAPNRDAAMKFLAEISKPAYQAEFTKYITYGPTNTVIQALPSKEFTVAPRDAYVQPQNINATLTYEQRITPNLDLQVAAYQYRDDAKAYNFEGATSASIDLNKQLPNGQNNPNFGKLYSDFFLDKQVQNHRVDEYRAQLTYHFDTKLWNIPLNQVFSASAGQQETDYDARQYNAQHQPNPPPPHLTREG